MSAEEDRLLDLAGAVSDATPIDWPAVSAAPGSDALRGAIDELALLARIADVHRSLDFQHLVADGAAAPAAPVRWGELTLLERVGAGAAGEVFRAYDDQLQREVALKLLHGDPAPGANSGTLEGRLLARVRHPGVVTVHGVATHAGRTGLWMEFVRGRTLAALLDERGPLPIDEVVRIGACVCEALTAVHGAGLLHRDVKAANVMLDQDGRVVLMDFSAGRQQVAGSVDVAGTPLYLAPELFTGDEPSTQSDVYSVGVLLFHLLTGSYPVEGRTVDDLRAAHAAGRRRSVREARPDVPGPLADVIDRAVAARSDDRHGGPSDLRAALLRTSGRGRHGTRRWPLMIAAAVTLAMTVAGVAWWDRPAPTPLAFKARDWILIAAFDNQTGDRQFAGSIESALAYALSDSAYVNVVPQERVEDALRLMGRRPDSAVTAEVGREIALRDGGIKLLVAGAILPVGRAMAVEARLVDPQNGAVVAALREEAATAADVPSAVRRLSLRLRARLGEASRAVTQSAVGLQKATTPSLGALKAFSDGMVAASGSRWAEADALFGAALAQDPGFASAHIWKAWTAFNLGRPREAFLARARRAVALAGTVSERERYFILGSAAYLGNDLNGAVGQFEALVQRFPDDVWGLRKLGEFYDAEGRAEDALAVSVRTAQKRPTDFFAVARAAQWTLRLRGLEAARPLAARARRLLAGVPPDAPYPDAIRTYIGMFPIHELWLQQSAREAASDLDALEARPETETDGYWSYVFLGSMRLTLGQLHAAERTFERIEIVPERSLWLAAVALARDDASRVAALIGTSDQTDLAAVSLLVRVRRLADAGHLLERLRPGIIPAIHNIWAADEIAEARGDAATIERARRGGLPWMPVMSGVRTYTYAESLARALTRRGETSAAIQVLEQVRAIREKVYTRVSQNGYFWMRTQQLLADLYRQVGRVDEAGRIDQDLLAALAAADADDPMRLELEQALGRAGH
jgi:serine/threonine protein kinase